MLQTTVAVVARDNAKNIIEVSEVIGETLVDVPHHLIFYQELHELPLLILQNPNKSAQPTPETISDTRTYLIPCVQKNAKAKPTIPRLQMSTFRKYPERSDSSSSPVSLATRRASVQPKPAAAADGAEEEEAAVENGARRRATSWRWGRDLR